VAHQAEAAAEAVSVGDLFVRLEQRAQMLRIDRNVMPTIYRGATLSIFEVEVLRTIRNVVRKGYLKRVGRDNLTLDQGTIDGKPDDLYVDCTARGINRRPPVPIFAGDRITLQMVRAGRVSLSAAVIGHIEASYSSDGIKNDLCIPIPAPDVTDDWPRDMLTDFRIAQRWAADKALRTWVANHRLSGAGFGTTGSSPSPEAARIRARIKEARPRAEANLERLVADLDRRR